MIRVTGESGIAWELVKSNDLNPIKGRLYKGVKEDRKGGWFFLEVGERVRKDKERE